MATTKNTSKQQHGDTHNGKDEDNGNKTVAMAMAIN
jgi:hypothetical protein